MPKILVVDDSDIVRMDLREALEAAGHTVLEGINGLSGLEKAQTNLDLDIIITDLNMPDMDGLSMCEEIKRMPSIVGIPILMLTTESSPDMKQQGKLAGVCGWIVKPFEPKAILMAVEKIIAKYPRTKAAS